jgi:glycine/D-amino acid oxidase-like deaminating enzyme
MAEQIAIPTSYWHATSEPLVPADELPSTAEVAVVGGGMLGCWTAYWLARAGVRVVLLERNVIGWGATGRNGGFLVGGTASGFGAMAKRIGEDAARQVETIAAEGREIAERVIGEEGIACDFRVPGTLLLALSDEELAEMRADMGVLAKSGFAGEVLDREQVQAMIRTPLGEEIRGATYARTGALVHSERYLCGIAQAASRHGARLVRAEVTGLAPDGDATRIETTAGPLSAGRVVLALNAWTDTLVPALAGKVVPVRGQILAYAPTAPVFEAAMGASVTPTGEYWQQVPDGSIVIGGCREDAPNGDVGVREMVPTGDVTDRIEQVLPRLFPELSDLPVARRWAGLMAFTSDYLPVADAAPEMQGVWVGGGFCGHGMPFGPRIGQLLAEATTTGTTPEALAPLRIDRPTLTPFGS